MKHRDLSRASQLQWRSHKVSAALVAALFAAPGITFADMPGPFNSNNTWLPYGELTARASTDNNLVRGRLVLPLYQNDMSMVFTDLRAEATDRNGSEYNAGLAYRRMNQKFNAIFGVYGFYDWKTTEDQK